MYRVYYREPGTEKWTKLSQFVNRGAAAMEYEMVIRKGYEARID
jgi:hypothetical protein